MAPGILNYLGIGSSSQKKNDTEAVRALPANWYTSEAMYEFEKRAVFSKKWLLVTHKLRLAEIGDYLKFDVAGYQIVLCRDRNGNINGFHNVCRHRAYPVVQQDSGSAKIFSCRYHGWSYGLDGKLAKAPKYDEISNFDKSQNGLLPVHVKVDTPGFVWVNLDASKTPEPWESDFDGIDVQERYKQYQFEDYVLDHEWEMKGAYNWKILVDNFNECYHCPTTHPDLPTLADIETHKSDCDYGWIQHSSTLTVAQKDSGLGLSSTWLCPNASIGIFPHYMMLQRFLPTGANSSTMHYQIFRNKHSSEEDFQLINQLYKRVVAEDKDLCERAQANLQRGIFTNGELHPRVEKGPLFFQKWIREAVWSHVELEKAAKKEIWPAKPSLPVTATVSKEDEDLCAGLACNTGSVGLAW